MHSHILGSAVHSPRTVLVLLFATTKPLTNHQSTYLFSIQIKYQHLILPSIFTRLNGMFAAQFDKR